MERAKKIISAGVAIPCFMLMCSQSADEAGCAIQIGAAVVLMAIMAWNGFFKKEAVDA